MNAFHGAAPPGPRAWVVPLLAVSMLIAGLPILLPVALGTPAPATSAAPGASGPLASGGGGAAQALNDIASATPSTPSALVSAGWHLPGPHPAVWGSSASPPGDPFAGRTSVTPSPGHPSPTTGPCFGLQPSADLLAPLPTACVAHDEPSLSFYSNFIGSGGNATWQLTLPTDTSATQNQSDLYAAAWIGLTVSDPAAWLGQCYVEIQFYPDFSWNFPTTTVAGVWSGAVIGWQINPSSGLVDSCYYSPMYIGGNPGAGYFEMSQGDQLALTLVGWPGSATGENVSLLDVTSGSSTSLNLYNSSASLPLDPAYPSEQFSQSLLWTTSGVAPLSFGFEIGREGNPGGVTNNTFGGCNPGPGAPTTGNPAVPCPSYDPVSWNNDTSTPWQIGIPSFSSSAGVSTPAQFGLSSSVGGGAAITNLSQETCLNRLGSSFCTYPWFSFSCSSNAFNFGAVDYAGESSDFGESAQYPTVATVNPLGLPQFSATNYSIPTCGAPSYTVTTATSGLPGGSVVLLSKAHSGSSSFTGLGSGVYGLDARAPTGALFSDWTVSGGVSVATANSPLTTLKVSGAGTVTAVFGSSAHTALVTFASTAPGSQIVVTPGLYGSNGTGWTVPSGGSLSLAAGAYAIQGVPTSGAVFDRWAVTAGTGGATVASVSSAVTWLEVTGTVANVTVTVVYASSALSSRVTVIGFGHGTLTFDGSSFPYNATSGYSEGNLTLAAGGYAATAVPAAGWTFLGWNYTASAVSIDANASTNFTLSGAVASVTALFAANITTFDVAPGSSGGRVAINGIGPLANQSVIPLLRGTYALDALPYGHNTFLQWTVSSSAELWVLKVGYPITKLQVNGTGTVTATFGVATNTSITFDNVPAAGGSISFNYQTYSGASTTNSSLVPGPYLMHAAANPGYEFTGWNVTSPNSLTAGVLDVTGSGGVVTAHFALVGNLLSFATSRLANIRADVGGSFLASGDSTPFASGVYPLSAVVGSNATFLRWAPTGSISVGNRSAAATNLTIYGPGTLLAVVDAFSLAGVSANRPYGEVGQPVTFTAEVGGVSPTSFAWSGLPSGCAAPAASFVHCTPALAGAVAVTVTVKGPNGIAVTSAPLNFSVSGALSLSSFTATRTVLDLGMSTVLTADVVGGAGPLSYSYGPLPTGCSPANASSFTCQPSAVGSTTVEATVTDGLGVVVSSNLTLFVYPDLALASVTATPGVLTAMSSFTVDVNATGGAPPLSYAYSGLPVGCLTADLANLVCSPSTNGSYTVHVVVTDAAAVVVAGNVTVSVNPPPSISAFQVTPEVLTVGETLTLVITASGGTGPLTYAVSGLPSGCLSENASAFTCQPNATGNFSLFASVTDSDHVVSPLVPGFVSVVSGPTPGSGAGANAGLSLWVWVLIAIVVAVAAILGYHYLRRQPAAPPPGSPPGSPPGPPPASPPETPK